MYFRIRNWHAREPDSVLITQHMRLLKRSTVWLMPCSHNQWCSHSPHQNGYKDDFIRHKLAKINGEATPDDADVWIRECEKIFRVIACIEA